MNYRCNSGIKKTLAMKKSKFFAKIIAQFKFWQ